MAVPSKVSEENWDAIWSLYVAGVRSLRQIGAQYGISEAAIRQKANKDGWVRNLTSKIQSKAEELVQLDSQETSRDTSQSVETSQLGVIGSEPKKYVPHPREEDIIRLNAVYQANIIKAERKDISEARTLAMHMLSELREQTLSKGMIDELAEAIEEVGEESDARKRSLKAKIEHVIGFTGRTDNMRKIAETLRTLIELERKVNRITDTEAEEDNDARVKINVTFE